MRRLVVYLVAGTLATAGVMPPAAVNAQEPEQEQTQTQAQPENRDLTLLVVGLGAIMGVIAFNIAAPPVVSWVGAVGRSLANVRAVTGVAGQRVMAGVIRAVPAAGAAAAEAAPAAEAVPAAAASAAPAAPIVAPLTQTMLAQAQIGGAAAAAAGAVVAHTLYRWLTGDSGEDGE
jgi:hypothetical protein